MFLIINKMNQSREKCDECGETLDYYSKKIMFIWGRSKKDVLEKMERCSENCQNAFDELSPNKPGLAANYYRKMSNIEDLKKKYYDENQDELEKVSKETYHYTPGSSLTIN